MNSEPRTHTKFAFRLGAAAIASIALGVLFAACASVDQTEQISDLSTPVVERVSRGRVHIRWPTTFTTGPVTIFAGATPETIDHSAPLTQTTGGFVELTAESHAGIDARHRLYYELRAAEGGASLIVAERGLPLQGADNVRDLGGYRTSDDRFVRWGVLFRSSDLADLTDRDVDHLSEIGVRVVCDLRAENEREIRPTRARLTPPPEILDCPIVQVGINPSEIQEAIRKGDLSSLGLQQSILAAYRSFPTDHRDLWASIFRRLEDPDNLPFLFHCTAGKDRTGFIAALVLLALGVPEQTVYEDYLATNQYRAKYNAMVLRWAPLYSLFRTSKDDLRPLLDARREYLEASLSEIRAHWGTVDTYLEDGLGLTAERREALRANLLTPPQVRSVRNPHPSRG